MTLNLRLQSERQQAAKLLDALKELQRATRREVGNLKFDILQSEDQAGDFLLIEEFQDDAAVKAHRASAHFQKFKDTTACMALVVERYKPLAAAHCRDQSES